jgi:hypothetical protein
MSTTLRPWYALATPHEDIRKGRLDEAVFAANLWAVARGSPDSPAVYRQPLDFYQRTFMTSGLSAVLRRVASVWRGDGESGDRIIGLQTGFGGGKSHILIALWHLAQHVEQLRNAGETADLRAALGDRFPQETRRVAVFTNETCDATQGRETPDGIRTHTLWGELALQLGGPALYETIRANDEARTVPQGLFASVLRAAALCLILIDELADYCIGAAAVPVGVTTLADQTISFVQQLTEAVEQVPGAVVVATLPASREEVAQSEAAQRAFVTLESRFYRLGADITPVADDEIYDVVRARLFDSLTPPGEEDYPARLARAYLAMYAAHAQEVPAAARRQEYAERIARAFPFHPSLIDAFHARWGSHPQFQRTRGVLRLLGSMVADLWDRRHTTAESQPLIQPCHVRWSIDALQGALTRLWGDGYRSVVVADLVGTEANTPSFDEERGGEYRRERIGSGLAAAILLGSFGGQAERTGFSTAELKLACARPEVNWGYLDGALLELESRCFYLQPPAPAAGGGQRYWFGTRVNLNKLVAQYRQQHAGRDFDAEIAVDLRAQAETGGPGATWRVLVDPAADLPEQRNLTLLILPPALPWGEDEAARERVRERARRLSLNCGEKDRIYRNTLLFLAGTFAGIDRLRQTRRELAALEAVRRDYGDHDQLGETQRADLEGRLKTAKNTYAGALGPAYTVALRVRGREEVETTDFTEPRSTFADHLGGLWKQLVEEDEWILRRVGSVTLREAGLVPDEGGIRVKEAIEAFQRYTDKPLITSRDAVASGLVQACKDGIIGIGRGTNPAVLQSRYCREELSLDPTEEGLWIIPPFTPEPPAAATTGAAGAASVSGSTGVPAPSPTTTPGTTYLPGGAPAAATGKPVRAFRVTGSVPLESYSELFRCFIDPAARMNLNSLRIGVDFRMESNPDSCVTTEDPALKAMREAARQLGLAFDVEE